MGIKSYVVPYFFDRGRLFVLLAAVRELRRAGRQIEPDGRFTLSLLGGKCDSREAAEHCIVREVCEETTTEVNLNPDELFLIARERSGKHTVETFAIHVPDLRSLVNIANQSSLRQRRDFLPQCFENSFVYLFELDRILGSPVLTGEEADRLYGDLPRQLYTRLPQYHNQPLADLQEMERALRTPGQVQLWFTVPSALRALKRLEDELREESLSPDRRGLTGVVPTKHCTCLPKLPKAPTHSRERRPGPGATSQ